MRLIDADSIPWDVDGVGEIPVITKDEIDAMPTVDAVPVEWIQNILTAMGNDSPYRPAIEWLLLTYKMEREEE